MKVNTVLAFGAHPDDVEFQCAGVLALLAQRGFEVHIATMAGGEVGSTVMPTQKIRQVRLDESADSAAVIGARFHYAGGHDCDISYDAEYRNRAIRVMREVNPDLVFTHPPIDYMIDHEETSRLVRNACFVAPIPNWDCGVALEPSTVVPHLYYWNAFGERDIFGRPLPLSGAVDVSSVLETKQTMLACHVSQREWLREHHHMDQYIENMKQSAFSQGKLIDRPAAEGYIQHLGSGYPNDNILAQVLGDLYVKL